METKFKTYRNLWKAAHAAIQGIDRPEYLQRGSATPQWCQSGRHSHYDNQLQVSCTTPSTVFLFFLIG